MKPRIFPLIFASLVLAQSETVDNYRGGVVTPPLPKPRFVLTDTSGAAFDFRQRTEGYVTLLFFGYANCPDQCPMHMATLGSALKKMPAEIADQVKLVFVTTDPKITEPTVTDVLSSARKNYEGPMEIGEDLMTIEIGNKIAVHRSAPSAR